MDDDVKAWCTAQRATILAKSRAPPAPQSSTATPATVLLHRPLMLPRRLSHCHRRSLRRRRPPSSLIPRSRKLLDSRGYLMPAGLRAPFLGSLDISMPRFATLYSSRLAICDDVFHRDNDPFVDAKSDRRMFLTFKFGVGVWGMRLGAGVPLFRGYAPAPHTVRCRTPYGSHEWRWLYLIQLEDNVTCASTINCI
jgi:hypothetical protein